MYSLLRRDLFRICARRQLGASRRSRDKVRRNVALIKLNPYDGAMAKEPSIEEAVERARRAQEGRLKTIRGIAEARQKLADVREETARELAQLQAQIAERVAEAEREDVRSYNAATSAGWTTEELKKIGFTEPDKKTRARRRTTRKPAAKTNGPATTATQPDVPAEAPRDTSPATAERQPVGA